MKINKLTLKFMWKNKYTRLETKVLRKRMTNRIGSWSCDWYLDKGMEK